MGKIDLDATMDAIAASINAAYPNQRTYAWPSENVEVPCVVVGYPLPGTLVFDMTFRDGSDEATFPVWFITGLVNDRAARTLISDVLRGATGIKEALDGNLGGVVQTCRVADADVDRVLIGAVQYIAVRFDLEVVT